MSKSIMGIDETLSEVCSAINRAEGNMRRHVKKYYHNADEEFITGLFYGQVKYALRVASQKHRIEKAFLKDLRSAIQSQHLPERHFGNQLRKQSDGLIADIVLHNKREEGKTGGDFGLIIVHPKILLTSSGSGMSLTIKKGISSGLLCQAKLKDQNGRWPDFTDNQKDILPEHLRYTSLVLYSYSDANANRSMLNRISWSPCRGQRMPEIVSSLKNDSFQERLCTTEILKRLGRNEGNSEGKIGTQDQDLIDKVVSPSTRQCLEIKIHWENDNDSKKDKILSVSRLQLQSQSHVIAKVRCV